MLSLHYLQTQFLENMFPLCKQKGNIQIYHNNLFLTLTKALSSIYPATEKVVGKDFFAATANHYIQQHPSTVNNVNDYGQHFATFLAEFPHAKSLPYLAELAQLEWGCHEIISAEDERKLILKELKEIPPEKYPQLKFQLANTSRLFNFQYPIYRIWQLCQQAENNNETIDLNEGGVQLLIARSQELVIPSAARDLQFDIKFYLLSTDEFAFLNSLATNKTISQACAAALALNPDFAATDILNKYSAHGIITNYLL